MSLDQICTFNGFSKLYWNITLIEATIKKINIKVITKKKVFIMILKNKSLWVGLVLKHVFMARY